MSDSSGKGVFETKDFQAEVKQLLDIVVNSLYTEREIFLRELISNAADALEKFRYESLTGQESIEKEELPLEITIELDQDQGTLTISDTGVGMTRDELVENLGTIAHSGSREFIRQLAEGGRKDLSLIGQFGVGFYSAFMVAKNIRVITRSYRSGAEDWMWHSDGVGSYSIGPAGKLSRGTKIVLELKDDLREEYTRPENIKRIIRQYSSFVPFPIKVNGEQINTVQAIWTRQKNEVTEDEYNEFYKFIDNAFDEPMYRLHFTADAPLAVNALLFVPRQNFERFGFGRMEPGVNLYCRKVLIQQHADGILPEWLRFVKGVVDSEDIPLNISRETMQDSALMSKLRRAVTSRFLKFLNEQAGKEPDRYGEFWKTFGAFIKEGAATDFTHRSELSKLLRFESTETEPGKFSSLKDYVGRMKEGQENIYFINGPNRETIEGGPYLEAFLARGLEVIFTYEPVDDFVLSSLADFEGKKLVSADQADLSLPPLEEEQAGEPLDIEKVEALNAWLKEILGDKAGEIRGSRRLVESPAIILNPDTMMTSSMQRVMQAMNRDLNSFTGKVLEINTRHSLVKRLSGLKDENPQLARLVAEQIFDNALISAGQAVEPRVMVDRIYRIMESAVTAKDIQI